MTNPNNSPNSRARQLRRNSTGPEKALWTLLRNRGLGSLKFRRQHPMGPFVVDYVCIEKMLVVEVDGDSHIGTARYDLERQQYLEQQGFRVLRVGNDDVLRDLDTVARAICLAAGVAFEVNDNIRNWVERISESRDRSLTQIVHRQNFHRFGNAARSQHNQSQ